MLDFNTLIIDDDDSVTIPILNAAGEPTGARWTLRSADSPKSVALVDKFTNARLSRMQRRQGTQTPLTTQELRAETVDSLVACVVGWEGMGSGQTELKFSEAAAREVLTKSVIIRDQVDAAVKDRSGFTKA